MQAGGKILAGGMFSSIGGQTRSLFARLTNDTAALQNLAVTQTTITWTLGGSSLQFTRVIFFRVFRRQCDLRFPGQRYGDWKQLDTNRFELADRTEHLHSRAGLLSPRLLQRLGEHHGIGAECVSE